MRHRARHLPAYLCLLVPLAVLAWLGIAEMTRQADRADRALQNQANAWVRRAAADLDRHFAERVRALLAASPAPVGDNGAGGSLPELARAVTERDPAVLDLFLLDRDGALVYPVAAPPLEAGLVFHQNSPSSSVHRAELLEQIGDTTGARAELERALEERGFRGRRFGGRDDRLRVTFALAGLCRRLGDNGSAEEHYLKALGDASNPRSRSRGPNELPAVAVLCELALAELREDPTRRDEQLVDLARAIAIGRHDGVPEPMLGAVLDRILAGVRPTSPRHAELLESRRTDDVRQRGRRFARSFDAFVVETVRRKLRVAANRDDDAPAGEPTVQQVIGASAPASLLAIRPVTDAERARGPELAWFGLRLDLDLLLAEALAADRAAGPDEEFALVVRDADGQVLVAPSDSAIVAATGAATASTAAGLQLTAAPIDPESSIRSRQTSSRRRAWFVIALCVAAIGGAFFLIRSASREAEVAQLKVDLVSRVSHELKTPLALIKMYSETIGLGRTRDAEQVQRFSGIISREADHLTRMVERVLDFSRREAGTIRYEKSDVDLGALVTAVTDAYRPHVRDRGLELAVEAEPDLGVEVDASALESAVVNLLENAVKYTGDGATAVEVSVGHDDATGDAFIEVLDRGIGVPTDERERIFGSFYRAANAGEVRGAGLGLSLVAHFVEAHGGRIEVRPRPGGGSIFRLTLPQAREDSVDDG